MSRNSLLAWILALVLLLPLGTAAALGIPLGDFIGFMVFDESQPVAEAPPTIAPITATLPPTNTPWPTPIPTITATPTVPPTATLVPIPSFRIQVDGIENMVNAGDLRCPYTLKADVPLEVLDGFRLREYYIGPKNNKKCSIFFVHPVTVEVGDTIPGYVRVLSLSDELLELLGSGLVETVPNEHGAIEVFFIGEVNEVLAQDLNFQIPK